MHARQRKIYELIKDSRYFKTLSNENWKKFLSLTVLKRFKAGDIVLQQGLKNQEVFCIINGSVSVEVDDQFIYTLGRKGDIFGEMSFISGEKSSATIRVVENLETLVLSPDSIKDIQDNSSHELHHIFYKWFAQILANKLFLTSQKAKKYEKMNQELAQVNNELASTNQILEDDLKVAAETQQTILSAGAVTVPFLASAKCYIPWGKVSGDMYYHALDKEGVFTFFLGDATGHGISAAFITMMCTMGLIAIDSETPTDEVMKKLNGLLASCSPPDKFMTGIFLRITESGSMTLTSAGHPPVIVIPEDGREAIVIEEAGIPLGMFAEVPAPYDKRSCTLKAGDKIFAYTDGVTEFISRSGELFGEKRLARFLEQNKESELETILADLLSELRKFSEGKEPDDDVTIFAFQMLS
ncbi:MAG: SpoIIE family protein phosphatase [SAR324 cluster bacterium]|nr:SpoIIE family protein phosphatase [SAR324 cluster bacterium]